MPAHDMAQCGVGLLPAGSGEGTAKLGQCFQLGSHGLFDFPHSHLLHFCPQRGTGSLGSTLGARSRQESTEHGQ